MDHIAEVRQFLKQVLAGRDDRQPFTDSTSLFLSGRLSSVDAVDLVVFLEERCAIDFTEVGFDQSKIDSIDAIRLLICAAGVSR
jgi:acyl carrier protein